MLYILFAVLLGAVCTRYALITDYMIASKVSLVGVLFLFGLYVSSLSSCLGAQYGAPRVLQCISKENVVPLIKPLGKGVSLQCYFASLEKKRNKFHTKVMCEKVCSLSDAL